MLKQLEGNKFQILRYPFVNTPAMTDVTISYAGYSFMSLLADGGINPEANYVYGYPVWWLRFFDDPIERMNLINSEIRNLHLPAFKVDGGHKKNLQPQIIMNWREAVGLSRTWEQGYGNWFIILSEYPIDFRFTKHNPYWKHGVIVGPDTTMDYWFGVDRPAIPFTLAIPYISPTYYFIRICIWLNGGQTTAKWYEYVNSAVCVEHTLQSGCNTINCCSDRHRIEFHNRDLVEATNVQVYVGFIIHTDI